MKMMSLRMLFLFVLAVQAAAQTTTRSNEESNNTSASSNFAGLTDFRTTDPLTTPSPWTLGTPIQTNPFDSSPGNVSKINVHSLMYPGFNGKILVETQTWFCSSLNGTFPRDYSQQNTHHFDECVPHLSVGYDSNAVSYATAAVNDMFSRGFDGFMADMAGGSGNCRTGTGPSGTPLSFTFTTPCPAKIANVDGAVQNMRDAVNNINSQHPNAMQFMVMEDQSAFAGSENCNVADQFQPLCFAQKIEADIAHYNSTYFSSGSYITNAAGSPQIAFFIAEEHQGHHADNTPINPIALEQCDSGPSACNFVNGTACGGTFINSNGSIVSNCWTKIWNEVRAHSTRTIAMVFRNQSGFSHVESDGAFQWVDANPATGVSINDTTQADWRNTFSNGHNEVDDFYQCLQPGGACIGKIAFGIAKKGFDREDAPFQDIGLGKITAQRCGQVWLDSFHEPQLIGFNSNNQIPFMLVGTWDDYEEGTEIETGIDNCYSISGSMNGSVLNLGT